MTERKESVYLPKVPPADFKYPVNELVIHPKREQISPQSEDWRERIEIAKEAMEQGKKIKKGKSVVFPRRFPPNKQ